MRIRSVEDRLFLRFRRTGDARALGRLFDRTAPDLLNVARYVAGDRASADDLVQATFLRAIEGAAGYDAARPVMPWLVGILTHQALDLRRARERAARIAPPSPRPDPGPAAEAAEAELRAACIAAVRNLRPPYAEVVSLHLDAGLDAVEIGQRLARPVDTVRKQLGRGLALLRRALPAGFAGAVAVGVTPAPALAAMRAVVTSRAAAVGAASGAGTAVLLGGLAMKKVTLAAVGLLALGLGVFATWPKDRSIVAGAASAGPDATVASSASAALAQQLAATTMSPTQLGRAPLSTSTAQPARCTVRGRCVDASTGATLEGVSATLHWGLDLEACRAAKVALGEPKMIEATTGHDGTFEFGFEPVVAARCSAELRLSGYVELSGGSVRLAAGDVHDFGDVALTRGCTVRGRVLDSQGRPQPNVRARLERQVLEVSSGWRQSQNANDLTDAAGTFVLPSALPSGRYGVTVHTRTVVEPGMVDLVAQPEHYLAITTRPLEEIPSIEGIVVDAAGTALSLVQINRMDARGAVDSSTVWTDRAGTFRILRRERDADGPFQLQLDAAGFQHTLTAERYAWGAVGLRLTLPGGVPMTVEVTDAGTGEPIEDFGVRWRAHPVSQPQMIAQQEQVRHRGRHPLGRLTLPVWRGRIFVAVEAGDAGYAPSGTFAVDVVEGATSLKVSLTRRVSTRIRFETADRAPVAGTEVEFLQPSFDVPVDTHTFVAPPDGGMTTGVNAARDLARGFTDAAGNLELMLPRNVTLAVRVLGPGVPLQVFCDRIFTADETVIVVDRGATLRGVLSSAARIAEFENASVRLRRDWGAGGEFPPQLSRRRIVPHPTTGEFQMVGAPAGTWTLELVWRDGGQFQVERLAEIEALREGEVRDAAFSLGAIQFGRVRLEVVADGERVDGSVDFGVELPLRGGVVEGRVRVGDLVPVVSFYRGSRRVTVALRPITVHAGELVERRFELSFGALRLHLVDAQGQPVRGAEVTASRGRGARTLTLSDADGRIEDLDMPLGAYRLRMRRLPLTDGAARTAFFAANPGAGDEALWVDLAEVEVTATAAEHRVVVPAAALR